MPQHNEIVNRVAASSLVTFDLEELYQPGTRVLLDVKDQLFQGLILKEKEFREFIRNTDWSVYSDKLVAVTCSADAIVPTWAFMLVTIALEPFAKTVFFGSLKQLEEKLFLDQLAKVDWSQYTGAKVVVKGCSKVQVPISAYVEAVRNLRPHVGSLMFGEACSTVPLYKKK
jgi:hypothetical protein